MRANQRRRFNSALPHCSHWWCCPRNEAFLRRGTRLGSPGDIEGLGYGLVQTGVVSSTCNGRHIKNHKNPVQPHRLDPRGTVDVLPSQVTDDFNNGTNNLVGCVVFEGEFPSFRTLVGFCAGTKSPTIENHLKRQPSTVGKSGELHHLFRSHSSKKNNNPIKKQPGLWGLLHLRCRCSRTVQFQTACLNSFSRASPETSSTHGDFSRFLSSSSLLGHFHFDI